MIAKRQLTSGDYVVVVLFAIVVVSTLVFTLTGIPYALIESTEMSFWLAILMPLGTIMSGIIFSYSLAQYTLEKQFRDLVLLLMAINMLLDGFLYLLTNTSFAAVFPFANRDRNRTIVIAFGLILGPSALFGSLNSFSSVTKRQLYSLLTWGGLIVPAVSLWFFFSPEPVFSTTPIGAGISGFSPIAWFFFLVVPSSMFYAIVKYIQAWRIERNRINLSSALALALWFLAVMLFASQTNPLQLMEIVWYSVFVGGLFLISVVIVTSSVIAPRKLMMDLVRKRTKQLEETREESEFYLNVWGHKIGNLLQSMILYLEMISTSSERDQKIIELADAAIEIGRETGQINRQVAALIKLKEKEDIELSPMNISEALASSLEITKSLYGPDSIQEEYRALSENIQVLADEFLELVFVNLLSFICKNSPQSKLTISPIVTPQTLAFQFAFDGPRIPLDIENSLFSEIQPSKTTLSLDLYTVKILMRKFNGVFEYSWIEQVKVNQFVLTFKQVFPDEDQAQSVVKHESASEQ
ncbi:MAG: hypothetical protein ACXAB5_02115 [Candidatus Thorarchaeota archaeon]|jgi:hypothetical protein